MDFFDGAHGSSTCAIVTPPMRRMFRGGEILFRAGVAMQLSLGAILAAYRDGLIPNPPIWW